MGWWWLSTAKWTCAVSTRGHMIADTPPLLRKFKGQPISNLMRWARSRWDDSLRVVRMEDV